MLTFHIIQPKKEKNQEKNQDIDHLLDTPTHPHNSQTDRHNPNLNEQALASGKKGEEGVDGVTFCDCGAAINYHIMSIEFWEISITRCLLTPSFLPVHVYHTPSPPSLSFPLTHQHLHFNPSAPLHSTLLSSALRHPATKQALHSYPGNPSYLNTYALKIHFHK